MSSITPSTVERAHFYRWRAAMEERAPRIPPDVLEAFYSGMDAGRGVSPEEVAEVLGCDAQTAAYWHAVAVVWLVDPAYYTPLFDSEDLMADCRAKRTAFVDDCKRTDEQLAEIDRQIAGHKAYGLLSPDQQAQVQPTIEALDSQREALLRHQSRDLPAVQEIMEWEEREVQQRLQSAQNAIAEAWKAQIDAVQTLWTAETLDRCEPLLEVLRRARSLDEALKALGRPGLSASAALHPAVVQRLRV